jgi:hypothetical protein
MKKKNFLLLAILLLLGFELLEVVGVVALLLLQEEYYRRGFFSTSLAAFLNAIKHSHEPFSFLMENQLQTTIVVALQLTSKKP